MTMKFEPFADRILVLPDASPPKKGGLAEPESQKDKPTQGIVVAVGPEADRTQVIDMERHEISVYGNPAGVSIGERVQFAKHSGRDVMHMGVKHLLLRLEEVEGRLIEVEDE